MKTCIAVPCFDYVMADFAFSLAGIMRHAGPHDIVLDGRGSDIAASRNKAAQYAVGGDFTHLMFLDSDMLLPGDTIHRLAAHGKPIVGASYVRRCEPHDLLGTPVTTWGGGPLVEALEMPTGCLLIAVAALRKIGAPWFDLAFDEHGRVGEDQYFCRKARAAGMKVYCDTELTKAVAHVGVARYTVRHGIEHIARLQMSKRETE